MAYFFKIALPCLLVIGCTSGSSEFGQRWIKDEASGRDRDATLTRCIDHSETEALGILNPSNVADNAAARKYFVRRCMEGNGWRLEPPSPPLPAPASR